MLTFYIPVFALVVFSSIIVGISFYAASLIYEVPKTGLEDKIPLSGEFRSIYMVHTTFDNFFDFAMPLMSNVIGVTAIGFVISTIVISILLYYLEKNRRVMDHWKEVGFFCERLEFLPANRVRLNNTEIVLNSSQYLTMKKLTVSCLKGEPLHSVDLGENATQVVKRLREELGGKILEKNLIVNHRGKGYWIDIDPKKVRGIDSDTNS